jgi:hypothetical protein
MVLDGDQEFKTSDSLPVSMAREWRSKYTAALFEIDRRMLRLRIQEAERVMLLRERELFSNPTATVERNALNNALNALRALRVCMGVDDR